MIQNRQRVTSSFKMMILMKTEIFNFFKETPQAVEARSRELSLRNTTLVAYNSVSRALPISDILRPVLSFALPSSSVLGVKNDGLRPSSDHQPRVTCFVPLLPSFPSSRYAATPVSLLECSYHLGRPAELLILAGSPLSSWSFLSQN